MKRKIFVILLFIIVIIGLFFLGLDDATGVELSLWGYDIETSIYTVAGLFLTACLVLNFVFGILASIKYICVYLYEWVTGRSKERAEQSLLTAYSYALAGKPQQAQKFLKKSEKYFQDNPHIDFLKLTTQHQMGGELPEKSMLSLSNKNDMADIYAASQLLYLADKTSEKSLELHEKSGLYRENKQAFIQYLSACLLHNDMVLADKITKSARTILGDNDYKIYHGYNQIVEMQNALTHKKPEQALSLSNNILKLIPDSHIGFIGAVSSFKFLLRENKAVRHIHDKFLKNPDFVAVKIFLDMRLDETPEALGKRISELPRQHQNAQAFLALQALHFAKALDMNMLKTTLRSAESMPFYHDDLTWIKAIRICLSVNNNLSLYNEAVELLRTTLEHSAYNEIMSEIQNAPEIYHDYLKNIFDFIHLQSTDGLSYGLRAFESILAYANVGQVKTQNLPFSPEEVQRLYNGDDYDQE